MSESWRRTLVTAQTVVQSLAMAMLVLAALALTGLSLGAILGHLPWLALSARFGEADWPQAGMVLQLAATTLLLGLCFYLPANARILALERSHRSFHAGMRDVALAYAVAHGEDRRGVFTLSSEFDSIRERIAFLRDHPDLSDLEPGIIELAAQMSHISRELARTYSDSNVGRARDFLIQRQQEIEDFNDRLADAKAITVELKRWHDRVDLEEAVARSQLDWLREELAEVLPELAEREHEQPQIAPEDKTAAPETGSSQGRHPVPPHDPADGDPDAPAPDGDPRIVELLQRRARQ